MTSPTGQRSIDLSIASSIIEMYCAIDVAVEGREQQLALAQVARAARGEHRVLADDRAQRRLGGERRRDVGRGGEERFDVIGMAGDHRVARDDSVEAEDVAELPAALEHELGLALAEAQHLASTAACRTAAHPSAARVLLP